MTEICFEGRYRDLERLPVWAQRYIENQARKIRQHEKRILELSSQFPETNVRASGWIENPDWTMPPNSHVEFRLGKNWLQDSISVRVTERGRLYINGTKQITVHPTSGNACEIYFDER